MTDNVIPVFGGPITNAAEPNAACVKTLEQWLERARSGKTIGVVIAAMDTDNMTQYELAGYVGSFNMMGALQMLQQHLIDINLEVE